MKKNYPLFKKDILSDEDLYCMLNDFYSDKDSILAGGFDTEADGLHIIYARPFLFQFGWITETHVNTYTVDIEQRKDLAYRTITMWNMLALGLPHNVGANIKFDLHMLLNLGLPYHGDNITDLEFYIRLGTDAIQEDKGGAPLALKKFAKRFINKDAAIHESEIKSLRSAMANDFNIMLRNRLGMKKKDIDAFFQDRLNTYEDLPEDKRKAYLDWYNTDVPLWMRGRFTTVITVDDIPYDKVDRAKVTEYGHYDVYYTLIGFVIMKAIVQERGNTIGINIENSTLRPLLDMERVGFYIDYSYLVESRDRMKEYMKLRRQDLQRICGRPIKASQSAVLLEIFKDMDVDVPSTGKEVLDLYKANLIRSGANPLAIDLIETIQELRTLEKWYSTYILRFVRDYRPEDGRLYTTIHCVGPVSGRVSSDFQQFPKGGIKTLAGEELFTPRRMVVLEEDSDYDAIVYLDYSQIELRFQALYTILIGHPDTNLCRAYMPYKCHTYIDGVIKYYDYTDIWCTKNATKIKWYYDEQPDKHWEPLDVHGATTKAAFDVTEDDEEYHDLRYIGKRTNFAKNYGAKRKKIEEMFPEFDQERITKIDEAYYIAFPGVKEYHNYCYKLAKVQAYATNLFGVRYYNVSGHNLINMLVQGSAAYFLKTKQVEVCDYISQYKSKYMMQIHDELQFKKHKDDSPEIFFKIKEIMEDWDDALVPIVADMEVTTKSWKDKYEVKSLEDFYGRQV